MSYDLHFYKQKGSSITSSDIAAYLTKNLTLPNKQKNQWFFESEKTEVYYSVEINDPETDDPEAHPHPDPDAPGSPQPKNFENFDNTTFAFNLNFGRPCFFGLEAFLFIEQFISDLDLYVLNPQSSNNSPYKPTKAELFDNWRPTNLSASKEHFSEVDATYISEDRSNAIWEYNFNVDLLQTELGDDYFVPKMFILKTITDNTVVTLSTWTQNIPNVFPPADYFILNQEYTKLFRLVKKAVLIPRQHLLDTFGEYFEEFRFKDCKIIRRLNAEKVKDKFNAVKSNLNIKKLAERLPMEQMLNAK